MEKRHSNCDLNQTRVALGNGSLEGGGTHQFPLDHPEIFNKTFDLKAGTNLDAIQPTFNPGGCKFKFWRCLVLNSNLRIPDLNKTFPSVGLGAEVGWTKKYKSILYRFGFSNLIVFCLTL